jgi:hypothetical protein
MPKSCGPRFADHAWRLNEAVTLELADECQRLAQHLQWVCCRCAATCHAWGLIAPGPIPTPDAWEAWTKDQTRRRDDPTVVLWQRLEGTQRAARRLLAAGLLWC